MGNLFVNKRLVDPYIVAIDSTLLRAKGHLWHKSSMIEGAVPRSGIDTDARWGFSHKELDIWVQAAYNSKYWFSYHTSISRFYSG
jgi:hypothetical protein